MTTQTFNAGRFMLTVRKNIGESNRQYLLFAFLIIGLTFAIFMLQAYNYLYHAEQFCNSIGTQTGALPATDDYFYTNFHDLQNNWFSAILIITSAIASSFAFSDMASKEGAIKPLMSPASQFEKFLARFVIFIIGTLIANAIAWILAKYATYGIFSIFTGYGLFYRPSSIMPWVNNNLLEIFAVTAFLQSFFFLGSTVWPRNSYIKTFGAGTLLFGTMVALAAISLSMIKDSMAINVLTSPTPKFARDVHTYDTLALILAAVNYSIAYLRFRENDVVRKW